DGCVAGRGRRRPGYRPTPYGLQLVVRPGAPAGAKGPERQAPETGAVSLGSMDPRHHGEAPAADAQGRLALPALIPGATYRIQERGHERTFRVEPGQAPELPDIAVREPARSASGSPSRGA